LFAQGLCVGENPRIAENGRKKLSVETPKLNWIAYVERYRERRLLKKPD
jgi:hypothetical protein